MCNLQSIRLIILLNVVGIFHFINKLKRAYRHVSSLLICNNFGTDLIPPNVFNDPWTEDYELVFAFFEFIFS